MILVGSTVSCLQLLVRWAAMPSLEATANGKSLATVSGYPFVVVKRRGLPWVERDAVYHGACTNFRKTQHSSHHRTFSHGRKRGDDQQPANETQPVAYISMHKIIS